MIRPFGIGGGGGGGTVPGSTNIGYAALNSAGIGFMFGDSLVPASTATTLSQAPSTTAGDGFDAFSLDYPRNVAITFPGDWDAGNVTVTDEIGSVEIFTADPGNTVVGSVIFRNAVQAVGEFDGSGVSNALIKAGKKILIQGSTGYNLQTASDSVTYVGILFVDNVIETVEIGLSVDGGIIGPEPYFSPTTSPNGSKRFVILALMTSQAGIDVDGGHTHTIG